MACFYQFWYFIHVFIIALFEYLLCKTESDSSVGDSSKSAQPLCWQKKHQDRCWKVLHSASGKSAKQRTLQLFVETL